MLIVNLLKLSRRLSYSSHSKLANELRVTLLNNRY